MSELNTTNKISFYLSIMNSRGFTPQQVLESTGLEVEQFEDEQFCPSRDQYQQLIHNIIQLTNDPFIGITFGSEYKLSNLGALGYAALCSSNLDQLRQVFDEYRELYELYFKITNHIQDKKWYSEITDPFLLGDTVRFAIEEFVSQCIEISSSLTDRPFPIIEMYVTYPEPDDLSLYKERFNCPIHFNQQRNIVVFDTERLNDQIELANQSVFELCEKQCQIKLNKKIESNLMSNKIRTYLVDNPGKIPVFKELAEHINISPRTLSRRLEEENTTYRTILDDSRKDAAMHYLKETTKAPKEIGYLLGYRSVHNFRRAFKGWTGKRLSEFR